MGRKPTDAAQRLVRQLADPKRKQLPADPPMPAETLVLERYRVSLECPTPLGHNPYEVEATSEQDAKDRFLLANGISDSEWPFTIEKL